MEGIVNICSVVFQNGVLVPLAMHMSTASILNHVMLAMMTAAAQQGGVLQNEATLCVVSAR